MGVLAAVRAFMKKEPVSTDWLTVGRDVFVTERPNLRGTIVGVPSENYAMVQFEGIQEPVGCSRQRLSPVVK